MRTGKRDWVDDALDGEVGWAEAIAGVLLGDPSPSDERSEAKRRRSLNGGPKRGDAFRTRDTNRDADR